MADAPALLAFLRVVHVLFAAVWLGGAAFFLGVVRPAATANPQVAGPFLQKVILRGSISAYFGLASGVTTLFGLILFWRVEAQDAYPTETLGGLLFHLGAAAGFVAFLLGLFLQIPLSKRMKALATEMSSGGPPKPEQVSRMQAMGGRMARDGTIALVLLAIALAGMLSAQNLLGVAL